MKFIIVFPVLLATAFAIAPELLALIKTETKAKAMECKAEMGATDDDIAPLLAHAPPTTDKGKCFLACMNKKAGIQDASGKISPAEAYSKLEKVKGMDEDYYNKAKQVADVCLTSVHEESDECETALSLYKCALAEKDKVGLPCIDYND